AANSLPPLALRTAFPSSVMGRYAHDYYGGSATSRTHQPSASLPASGLDGRTTGRARDASHVHRAPVDG
ncbi:hypothetical protein, partial [Micromonospora craniellae]|uniref:hypothetical protein n=1 Tax=Micromonospora craniellae TaxID=2294034 RepID=UPI001F2B2D80